MPLRTYKKIPEDKDGNKYIRLTYLLYHSKMFNQDVEIKVGDLSDGASGAFDIPSESWWVHDQLCKTGTWLGGDKLCNFTASTVLANILFSEGHYRRSFYWWWATFWFGGGECRKNGRWRVKA
jgi:hypothetical protein